MHGYNKASNDVPPTYKAFFSVVVVAEEVVSNLEQCVDSSRLVFLMVLGYKKVKTMSVDYVKETTIHMYSSKQRNLAFNKTTAFFQNLNSFRDELRMKPLGCRPIRNFILWQKLTSDFCINDQQLNQNSILELELSSTTARKIYASKNIKQSLVIFICKPEMQKY